MEWLRSCYSSAWNVFAGSAVITKGYYYFADSKSPFFPLPHIYFSRNWTTDNTPAVLFPLGERRKETGQRQEWRNGFFPFVRPPAVKLGDDDCFVGERLPLPVVSRILIFGVDTRCYTQIPSVPAGFPWAWFRPESLMPLANLTPVKEWRDDSGNSRNAVAGLLVNEPVYFKGGPAGLGHVQFALAQGLFLPTDPSLLGPFDLGTQVTVYMVGTTSAQIGFSPVWGPALQVIDAGFPFCPGYQGTLSFYADSLQANAVPQDVLSSVKLTMFVRRNGASAIVGVVGHQTHTVVTSTGTVRPVGLTVTKIGADVNRRRAFISELLIYDRALTDDEHTATLAYLATKYP